MIEDYFTPSWKIMRATVTNDNGIAKTNFAIIDTVYGRMRPLSGYERQMNEKNNYITTHRFYCKAFNIRNNDILVSPEGEIYDVKYISNPFSANSFLQVDCDYGINLSDSSPEIQELKNIIMTNNY